MSSAADAQKAISTLNGRELQGRTSNVSEAKERSSGGGGRPRGGFGGRQLLGGFGRRDAPTCRAAGLRRIGKRDDRSRCENGRE